MTKATHLVQVSQAEQFHIGGISLIVTGLGGQYLAEDLLDALRDVERLAPNLKDEPDHRAIACASWIMNLGKGNFASSTMLKRIREGKWEAAAKEMKRWDKVTVGGKKKPFRALTRRRLTEAHLFLTGEVKTFL